MQEEDKRTFNALIEQYHELLEEVKQLRERRKNALIIIEKHRDRIAELEKELREKNEQQKSRRKYISIGQI